MGWVIEKVRKVREGLVVGTGSGGEHLSPKLTYSSLPACPQVLSAPA